MDVTNAQLRQAGPTRRDPAARSIAREWRRLAAGEPVLAACSGGVDSTALALCLHAAGAPVTLGHIVHDMRPADAARADRDFVRELAARLGAPFVEAAVSMTGQGNVEAAARRLRYGALGALAAEAGIAHLATAHQADDQFESMVMALLRGAGPAGLAGVAARRRLAPGVALIRPMLGVGRADCVRVCEAAGVDWREDATNLDVSRLRSALRHGALRELERLRPGAARRAARSAALLRDAAGLVKDRVREVFGDATEWEREAIRAERAIVVGAGLRRATLRLTGGRGADRLGGRMVDPAVRAARDSSTEPRRFEWPGGVTVRVDARLVSVARERGRG